MKRLFSTILIIFSSFNLFAQPKSIINKKDTMLFLPYKKGKAPFSCNGKMGIIDTAGKIILPATFSRITEELDSYSIFPYLIYWEGKNLGILCKSYSIVIVAGTYDKLDAMIDGFFRVKKNGKFSFVDSSGKCLDQWYDDASFFNYGKAAVKIGKK